MRRTVLITALAAAAAASPPSAERDPDLVTLHVWLRYHNPDGLYSGTNPLVRPFNKG